MYSLLESVSVQPVRFPHQPPRAIPYGRFAKSAAGDETDFGLLDLVPTQPTQRKQLSVEPFSLRSKLSELRAPREMLTLAKISVFYRAHLDRSSSLPLVTRASTASVSLAVAAPKSYGRLSISSERGIRTVFFADVWMVDKFVSLRSN